MRVAAKTAYTSLRIILVYECNANVVYFDGVQLFNTYAINNDRRIKNYGRVTMDKPAFLKKLCEYGIDTNIVCFNDSAKDDVFCVINNHGYTDVFYRERGCEYDRHRFLSQPEALQYLLNKILTIAGICSKNNSFSDELTDSSTV